MRQVQLGLPGAVGGGTVAVPKVPGEGASLPGANENFSPVATGRDGIPYTTGNTGETFGRVGEPSCHAGTGGTPPPVPVPALKSRRSEEPATGINLSGCFETWGVPTNQSLETTRIEFSGLTAQQIKQILMRIPSAFKATIEIAYKEGEEQ